jgi:carbonic anhydrase/acetyltransferase-like protein (isoleucine patch superfamily)
VSRRARVHRRATLNPPVFVGDGAWVRANASVGPAAIIGDEAVVGPGASVARAIVPATTVIQRSGSQQQQAVGGWLRAAVAFFLVPLIGLTMLFVGLFDPRGA